MNDEGQKTWLPVIGKTLAYLCLADVVAKSPKEKYDALLSKVGFLESLGVPTDDAALLVGSTPASVRVTRNTEKRKKNGKSKAKSETRKKT